MDSVRVVMEYVAGKTKRACQAGSFSGYTNQLIQLGNFLFLLHVHV